MRNHSFVTSFVALLLATACGGDTDGEDRTDPLDDGGGGSGHAPGGARGGAGGAGSGAGGTATSGAGGAPASGGVATRGDCTPQAPPPDYAACGTRWDGVSDQCWACLCAQCPAETATCTGTCWPVIECAKAHDCLKDAATEIVCLIANCGSVLGAAPGVAAWDMCVLEGAAAADPAQCAFPRRACDVECGIH